MIVAIIWDVLADENMRSPLIRRDGADVKGGPGVSSVPDFLFRAGWRQDFQTVFLRDLQHARDVLLLGRSHGADFPEELFEARRSDDAEKPAALGTDATVRVGHVARGEQGRARPGEDGPALDHKFVVARQHLKRFVLAMMEVGRWPAAGSIVGFHHTQGAAGLASGNPDDNRNAEDIHPLAAVRRNLDRIHARNIL